MRKKKEHRTRSPRLADGPGGSHLLCWHGRREQLVQHATGTVGISRWEEGKASELAQCAERLRTILQQALSI